MSLETIQKHDVVDEPYPKVLDMCCGCGNFLISAYEILHKKFLENIDNLRPDGEYFYRQYLVAKGYSEFWKGNMFVEV